MGGPPLRFRKSGSLSARRFRRTHAKASWGDLSPSPYRSPSPLHKPERHVVGGLGLRVDIGAATLLRLCRGRVSIEDLPFGRYLLGALRLPLGRCYGLCTFPSCTCYLPFGRYL